MKSRINANIYGIFCHYYFSKLYLSRLLGLLGHETLHAVNDDGTELSQKQEDEFNKYKDEHPEMTNEEIINHFKEKWGDVYSEEIEEDLNAHVFGLKIWSSLKNQYIIKDSKMDTHLMIYEMGEDAYKKYIMQTELLGFNYSKEQENSIKSDIKFYNQMSQYMKKEWEKKEEEEPDEAHERNYLYWDIRVEIAKEMDEKQYYDIYNKDSVRIGIYDYSRHFYNSLSNSYYKADLKNKQPIEYRDEQMEIDWDINDITIYEEVDEDGNTYNELHGYVFTATSTIDEGHYSTEEEKAYHDVYAYYYQARIYTNKEGQSSIDPLEDVGCRYTYDFEKGIDYQNPLEASKRLKDLYDKINAIKTYKLSAYGFKIKEVAPTPKEITDIKNLSKEAIGKQSENFLNKLFSELNKNSKIEIGTGAASAISNDIEKFFGSEIGKKLLQNPKIAEILKISLKSISKGTGAISTIDSAANFFDSFIQLGNKIKNGEEVTNRDVLGILVDTVSIGLAISLMGETGNPNAAFAASVATNSISNLIENLDSDFLDSPVGSSENYKEIMKDIYENPAIYIFK